MFSAEGGGGRHQFGRYVVNDDSLLTGGGHSPGINPLMLQWLASAEIGSSSAAQRELGMSPISRRNAIHRSRFNGSFSCRGCRSWVQNDRELRPGSGGSPSDPIKSQTKRHLRKNTDVSASCARTIYFHHICARSASIQGGRDQAYTRCAEVEQDGHLLPTQVREKKRCFHANVIHQKSGLLFSCWGNRRLKQPSSVPFVCFLYRSRNCCFWR